MNRLTGIDELGYYMPCDMTMNCLKHRGECVDHLGAYEDTGLTPGEVAKYKKFEDEAVSKGVPFSRIVELMNADKDGRLVVLPVKQDAIIYSISKGCSVPMQSRLEGCFITESGEIEYQAMFGDVLESDFGKTVFLTHEEAEQALKEAKDDG